MVAERSNFKGSNVLILKKNEDDKYPFSFGVAKAKMILENIEEIKKFILDNERV
jgi:hypothetical protein